MDALKKNSKEARLSDRSCITNIKSLDCKLSSFLISAAKDQITEDATGNIEEILTGILTLSQRLQIQLDRNFDVSPAATDLAFVKLISYLC